VEEEEEIVFLGREKVPFLAAGLAAVWVGGGKEGVRECTIRPHM